MAQTPCGFSEDVQVLGWECRQFTMLRTRWTPYTPRQPVTGPIRIRGAELGTYPLQEGYKGLQCVGPKVVFLFSAIVTCVDSTKR
jgi:hypothetical protein